MAYRVGLTGGIASGKSTVAAMFHELGVPILDADEIAREVVEPGTAALSEIVSTFGPDVLTTDGQLDRPAMRARIFQNVADRRKLEAIVHPRVQRVIRDRLRQVRGPYCIIVIPLLVEAGYAESVDRVLVIDVDEATQQKRLRMRAGWSDETIDGVLNAQLEREERLRYADDVIPNTGSMKSLGREVALLHERYMTLAAQQSR